MSSTGQDPTDIEKEYRLGRGGHESIRLIAQHWLFKARQGWLLHPTITTAIQHLPNPRIADIATGTALWPIELSQELPHADIIALDITDKQYPPPFSLPPNVTLGLYDVLQPVPADLQGTFDVVHVRLLLPAGPDVDKGIFINCFRTLLRPGGWLQWDEVLSAPLLINRTQSSPTQVVSTPLTDHPMIHIRNKYMALSRRCDWIIDFEHHMTQAGGFTNQCRHIIPPRPELLSVDSALVCRVLVALVEIFIEKKLDSRAEVVQEMKDAVRWLNDDIDVGMMLAYAWNVCIAQKG